MKSITNSTAVRVVIVMILVLLCVQYVMLRLENNELLERAEELRIEVSNMNDYVNELQAQYDRPFDDEYVAEIAHEKLGLRFPQEIIYYSGDGG